MKGHLGNKLKNKILFFFSVWGCCSGFYTALLNRYKPHSYTLYNILSFVGLLAVGIIIGVITEAKYKSNKNLLLSKDKYGIYIFHKQRIFLLSIAVAVVTWFINNNVDLKQRIVITIMISVVFIVGLSGGMYDQFGPSAGRMLLAGMIPLSGSVIFIIIGVPEDIRAIIWSSGFIYLLCSFLILNGLQLGSNVFMVQNINIESTRKIRNHNLILSIILSVFCIVFIMLSKVLSLTKSIILRVFSALYSIIKKFSEWITYDYWYKGIGDPNPGLPVEWKESSYPFTIVKLLLVITVIIAVIAIVIFLITVLKKIKRKSSRKFSTANNVEFIEESEIIREKTKLFSLRKNKYTIHELETINDTNKKIRYLYGFILERLYIKGINFTGSDTPTDIYNIVLRYPFKKEFQEIGFEDLTDNYKKVRYGNKISTLKNDIVRIAKEYEDVLNSLNLENK